MRILFTRFKNKNSFYQCKDISKEKMGKQKVSKAVKTFTQRES